MKKLFAVTLLLCALALCARADMAENITKACAFRFPGADGRATHMYDDDYETYMQAENKHDPVLYITTGETPAAGVYVEFGVRRLPFTVEVKQGKSWTVLAQNAGQFAQEYVAFPPTCGELRLKFDTGGRSRTIRVCEITVLGEGDIDKERIHIWQPTVEKADLMLSATHADDELLWFGGMIPYYARERGMAVLVTYLGVRDSYRELELLNGLWHCGVRNYPEIGYFQDFKSYSKKDVYTRWDREKVRQYLIEVIRKYRPEVVVTHDFDGEYGHGQHLVCAESTQYAVEYAADAEKYRDSSKKYGTWSVKKFYVHLGDHPTIMDWHQPLESFNGKTSFEIASEAYAMHRSQLKGGKIYEMAERGTVYDSFAFTLIRTQVGEDQQGGDVFEHIPEENLTTFRKKQEDR